MGDEAEESMFDSLMQAATPKARKRRSKRAETDEDEGAPTFTDRLTQVVPIVLKIEEGIAAAVLFIMPYVKMANEAYEEFLVALEPYGPKEIMGMLYGLALMFFGGSYISTIATLEAIDQGGRKDLVHAIKELHEQATSVRDANRTDDQLDEDGDGVADVNQISQAELTVRKVSLFLRSCDPEKVSAAFGRLYQILAMVIATLQVKFARALSLGVSIGNVLSTTILKATGPTIKNIVDEDYYPWIPVVTRYICRMIGISIAFSVQRVLSTVHTALNGARIATDAFTRWCEARNLHYLSDGYLDDATAFLLAGLGIYGQLFLYTKLPFIIKLILFPATVSEYILTFMVSTSVARGTTTANQQQGFSHGPTEPMPGMPEM
ncbi:Hypothetical Protein FCC1311_032802 [Hondaea fermentalgiana]|uniref:Uncharacterized protein n=1 Tax=Hondaea fermentalgiana TaxID=2315210 RepID=A0A2R5G7P4_9STRA|nr:Hypothetical Protein FCC1311_032802 [Hondaea fermentalgiana]|eukprot:GBG27057.1 Hypothetical Protein FCC1311_032802 [Hondaea fermentalgiana]